MSDSAAQGDDPVLRGLVRIIDHDWSAARVVEIAEQAEIDDDELDAIRERFGDSLVAEVLGSC